CTHRAGDETTARLQLRPEDRQPEHLHLGPAADLPAGAPGAGYGWRVHVTLGRALAGGATVLALAATARAGASAVIPGTGTGRAAAVGQVAATGPAVDASRSTGPGQSIGTSQSTGTGRSTGTSQSTGTGRSTGAGASPAGHVVLVGIGGLRWSDVSPTATQALWRLVGEGSAGSLVVSGIHPRTCPADGWLTLNAAARAAVPHAAVGPCPADPRITVQSSPARPGTPSPARVPQMPRLVAYNSRFHYNPQWGLLAAAPGRAGRSGSPGSPGSLSPAGSLSPVGPS